MPPWLRQRRAGPRSGSCSGTRSWTEGRTWGGLLLAHNDYLRAERVELRDASVARSNDGAATEALGYPISPQLRSEFIALPGKALLEACRAATLSVLVSEGYDGLAPPTDPGRSRARTEHRNAHRLGFRRSHEYRDRASRCLEGRDPGRIGGDVIERSIGLGRAAASSAPSAFRKHRLLRVRALARSSSTRASCTEWDRIGSTFAWREASLVGAFRRCASTLPGRATAPEPTADFPTKCRRSPICAAP